MLDTQNHFFQIDVRVGKIQARWNEAGQLTALHLLCEENEESPKQAMQGSGKIPQGVVDILEKIRAYFNEGCPIGPVPWDLLNLEDVSPFQREVYDATTRIPHGETRSYAWVAQRTGKPKACRAVGQALRKNPFPVLVPCHRVIPAHGGLGGFMGHSEPDSPNVLSKKRLIEIEHDYLNPVFPFLNAFAI